MTLNLAKGRWRTGRDRMNRFRIAAGSASEARACLQLAEAWGLVPPDLVQRPLELLDRLLAMTWRLLHPRPFQGTPSTPPVADHGFGHDCDADSGPSAAPDPDTTESKKQRRDL